MPDHTLRSEFVELVHGKKTPEELASVALELERRYSNPRPEAVRMLIAITRGSMMGGNDGWFGPAQSRYSWPWLAELHGLPVDGGIDAKSFRGEPAWFTRLDRNRNGVITAEDFDWSEQSHWVKHAYVVNRLLRRLDTTGDGRLTRDEWLSFFDTVGRGSDEVKHEDLRDAWIAGISDSFFPGDAPTQDHLLQGLLAGELGSLDEGPALNESAPDFTLKTQDGSRTIRLADLIGPKPVVLVFGNFTCSPFRSMYPGVEEVSRRFPDQATFVGVYVREAHPTDGWKMESNARVGVAVAQPRTYDERAGVARQCHRLLNASIPLLVDDVDDSVGNAYSGMPARLYVIDTDGKIAYKAGRGPFGFKVGEMEQALLMTFISRAVNQE